MLKLAGRLSAVYPDYWLILVVAPVLPGRGGCAARPRQRLPPAGVTGITTATANRPGK
jgi:hypothetical protein